MCNESQTHSLPTATTRAVQEPRPAPGGDVLPTAAEELCSPCVYFTWRGPPVLHFPLRPEKQAEEAADDIRLSSSIAEPLGSKRFYTFNIIAAFMKNETGLQSTKATLPLQSSSAIFAELCTSFQPRLVSEHLSAFFMAPCLAAGSQCEKGNALNGSYHPGRRGRQHLPEARCQHKLQGHSS